MAEGNWSAMPPLTSSRRELVPAAPCCVQATKGASAHQRHQHVALERVGPPAPVAEGGPIRRAAVHHPLLHGGKAGPKAPEAVCVNLLACGGQQWDARLGLEKFDECGRARQRGGAEAASQAAY